MLGGCKINSSAASWDIKNNLFMPENGAHPVINFPLHHKFHLRIHGAMTHVYFPSLQILHELEPKNAQVIIPNILHCNRATSNYYIHTSTHPDSIIYAVSLVTQINLALQKLYQWHWHPV